MRDLQNLLSCFGVKNSQQHLNWTMLNATWTSNMFKSCTSLQFLSNHLTSFEGVLSFSAFLNFIKGLIIKHKSIMNIFPLCFKFLNFHPNPIFVSHLDMLSYLVLTNHQPSQFWLLLFLIVKNITAQISKNMITKSRQIESKGIDFFFFHCHGRRLHLLVILHLVGLYWELCSATCQGMC